MRVVHYPAGDARVLATEVEIADGLLRRGRGLMFRQSLPTNHALVLRFDSQAERQVHMVFVPFAIDAIWLCDEVVQRVATLSPWTGHGRAVADTVIELPVGVAKAVSAGDQVGIRADGPPDAEP